MYLILFVVMKAELAIAVWQVRTVNAVAAALNSHFKQGGRK